MSLNRVEDFFIADVGLNICIIGAQGIVGVGAIIRTFT
jgi:hypothetical protein